MDRLVQVLALQIPQRDVDAAEPLDDGTLLPVIAIAGIQLVPDVLAAHGILSNQEAGEFPHDGGIDPRGPITLAPADQPLIGDDLHDH